MSDCMFCVKDERLTKLMTEVIRLDATTVYWWKEQSHPGRCVVAPNKHVRKLTDMTPEEQTAWWADVSKVANVLDELYHPDKINYLIMGDKAPHLHMHITTKYEGGASWGTMFTVHPQPPVYISAEEEAAEVAKIRAALEK